MVILSLYFLGVAGFESDSFIMGAILGTIPVSGLALDIP
jgi:hypothetical protein